MAYALELHLDAAAAEAVRGLWAALDGAGERSLAGAPHPVPHVSLAVFERWEQRRAEGALAGALRGAFGLPLTLGSLGFFPGPAPVAFLGVAPTLALVAAHRAVLGALEPAIAGLWEHYRADALVPHCTLIMAVRDPAVVATTAVGRLPITARVTGAAVVEVSTGRPVLEFAGRGG